MKTKGLFLLVLTIFIALPSFSQENKWEYLGEKLVNDRLDHDVLIVTAERGDLKSIQLRVKRTSVNFHKVVIVFGDGQRQEVALRRTIPAGGMSRAIDLVGKERIIKKIEFWYDANAIRGRKAIVRVFGRT